MTKRMIDADAFEELLCWLDKNFEYCQDIHNIEKKVVSYGFLLKTIKELATPEPKDNTWHYFYYSHYLTAYFCRSLY